MKHNFEKSLIIRKSKRNKINQIRAAIFTRVTRISNRVTKTQFPVKVAKIMTWSRLLQLEARLTQSMIPTNWPKVKLKLARIRYIHNLSLTPTKAQSSTRPRQQIEWRIQSIRKKINLKEIATKQWKRLLSIIRNHRSQKSLKRGLTMYNMT